MVPAGFFVFLSLVCFGCQTPAETPKSFEPVIVTAKVEKIPPGTGLDQQQVVVEAAFVLSSSHPDFGGLSGLWISEDRRDLMAVSDRGHLWRAELIHDDNGQLLGVGQWTISTIRQSDGRDWRRTSDAEALSGSVDQELTIAYEGSHQLLRLPVTDLQAEPRRLPVPGGLGVPSNSGIETLATMEDGRLLAIAERVGAWGGVGLSAWLIGENKIEDLVYVPASGFAPTGGDRLDDWLYVVERRFSLLGGFQSKIKAIPTNQVQPGSHMEGRLLAAFQWGDLGENFEGLVAKKAPDGRTLLYLIADDNFSFLQETVLLQLSLPKASTPTN